MYASTRLFSQFQQVMDRSVLSTPRTRVQVILVLLSTDLGCLRKDF